MAWARNWTNGQHHLHYSISPYLFIAPPYLSQGVVAHEQIKGRLVVGRVLHDLLVHLRRLLILPGTHERVADVALDLTGPRGLTVRHGGTCFGERGMGK